MRVCADDPKQVRFSDSQSGKHAFLGLGFRERQIAFDFRATLQVQELPVRVAPLWNVLAMGYHFKNKNYLFARSFSVPMMNATSI